MAIILPEIKYLKQPQFGRRQPSIWDDIMLIYKWDNYISMRDKVYNSIPSCLLILQEQINTMTLQYTHNRAVHWEQCSTRGSISSFPCPKPWDSYFRFKLVSVLKLFGVRRTIGFQLKKCMCDLVSGFNRFLNTDFNIILIHSIPRGSQTTKKVLPQTNLWRNI